MQFKIENCNFIVHQSKYPMLLNTPNQHGERGYVYPNRSLDLLMDAFSEARDRISSENNYQKIWDHIDLERAWMLVSKNIQSDEYYFSEGIEDLINIMISQVVDGFLSHFQTNIARLSKTFPSSRIVKYTLLTDNPQKLLLPVTEFLDRFKNNSLSGKFQILIDIQPFNRQLKALR